MDPSSQETHPIPRPKRIRRILLVGFISLLLLGSVGAWLLSRYTSTILENVKGEDISVEQAGIEPAVQERINLYDNKIKNVLLIGIDRNNDLSDPQRSDTMMVVSLDDKHQSLKFSSFMRDTYVRIPGYKTTKLNHAYAYGGIRLLVRTINQNFELDVEDYILVDFHNLIAIIDAVGGIEIAVQENEVVYLNNGIRNLNRLEGTDVPLLTTAGTFHLNGTQATAYARIRSTRGGDYTRSERQQLILEKIYDKFRHAAVFDLAQYITRVSPYVKTNLTYSEMFDFGLKLLSKEFRLEGTHFPTANTAKEITKPIWYLKMDQPATVDELHRFIYEDIKPEKTKKYLNPEDPDSDARPDPQPGPEPDLN